MSIKLQKNLWFSLFGLCIVVIVVYIKIFFDFALPENTFLSTKINNAVDNIEPEVDLVDSIQKKNQEGNTISKETTPFIKKQPVNADLIKEIYDDGIPSVSIAELESLHEQQRKQITDDLDAVAIEATEDNQQVTRRELESLHEEQKMEITKELNGSELVEIPAFDDQHEVTHRNLLSLQEKQYNEIKEQSDAFIAVESTEENQKSITVAELEKLHKSQEIEIEQYEKIDLDRIRLKNLHDEQNIEMINESFDADKVVIEE